MTIGSICASGARSRRSAWTARGTREIALAALAGRVQEHRFVFAQPLERGGHDVSGARKVGVGFADAPQNLFVGKPFVEQRKPLAAVVGLAVLVALRSAVLEHRGVL